MSATNTNRTLIELNIKPCAYVQEVMEGSARKLIEGAGDNNEIAYLFKVSGENRIVAIIIGDPEVITLSQSKSYGELTEIRCTLLRTYESFADTVLGVDSNLIDAVKKIEIRSKLHDDGPGILFWVVMTWENQATVTRFDDMVKILREQATHIMTLKKQGFLADYFKVVSDNQMHAFIRAQNAEAIDDMIFGYPLLKKLVGHVKIQTKQIQLIKLQR